MAVTFHQQEPHNDAFYTTEGWRSEPLTALLGVPGEDIGNIFPPSDPALCLTLQKDGIDIGHSSANEWIKFINGLVVNLFNYSNTKHPGTKKFAEILRRVAQFEADYFAHRNIGKIAHTSGLMVLNAYRGGGLATELRKRHLALLQHRGFEYVITETTNKASAKVMEKLGYTKLTAFPYPAMGIALDDEYGIWILKL